MNQSSTNTPTLQHSILLGVNSVLFQGHDLATAMQHIAWAGYDGVELSAIKGMCEHLDLDNWRTQADTIKSLAAVCCAEGLPTPKPLSPGELRTIDHTACGEFLARIGSAQVVPRSTGSSSLVRRNGHGGN